MKKGESRRREGLGYRITVKGQPFDECQETIPDERLDQFLQFLARLIVRDLRDYPELSIDKVIIDEPAIDDNAPRCTKTSTSK